MHTQHTEGFGTDACVHTAGSHLAALMLNGDSYTASDSGAPNVYPSTRALRGVRNISTSRSWTHKHSCTSGSVQGKQPQQTADKNTRNTVLAASAHVLPFFFFCLSLIVDVLLQSSVECVCSSWNVALVTA